MKTESEKRILVLTVGTGEDSDIEGTLLKPMEFSICSNAWKQVILLATPATKQNAKALKRRNSNMDFRIYSLCNEGDESDTNSCFEQFDNIFENLLKQQDVEPEHIEVDFTRGTRVMNVSLVLAALRRDIPILRYIGGERGPDGKTLPGKEEIISTDTAKVTVSRQRDLARQFMRQGDFAAAESLLSKIKSLWSNLANFYNTWDQLNYAEASAIDTLPSKNDLPIDWQQLAVNDDALGWVNELATPPCSDDYRGMARYLRCIAADLQANGQRRIRNHQFEDALLRGYRILELIGQARLFDHDIDSAKISAKHCKVQQFRNKLKKNKSHDLDENADGTFKASREQVARLLKFLGDHLAEQLISLGTRLGVRNTSILIHGFEVKAVNREELERLYAELEKILIQDDDEAKSRLARARLIDFR